MIIKIDIKRRERLKRLHTATHILNYCSKKILGNHIWQNGSNLKEEIGTLDITHYKFPTQEELRKIENLANSIIFENRKVVIEETKRGDAEKKYGFTLYQGGAIPLKKLRIVKVENSDIEACGGLHVKSTREIGLIKITQVSKVQDGVIRLSFKAHNFALEDIEEKEKILQKTSDILGVSPLHIPKAADRFFNEWKQKKKDVEKLQSTLKDTYKKHIIPRGVEKFKIEENLSTKFLIELFKEITDNTKNFTLESKTLTISTQNNLKGDFKKIIPRKNFTLYTKNETI